MVMRAEILQLQDWSDAYYLGMPKVSDEVFDARVIELKEKYPDDPFWLTVGTSSRANAVKLPHKKGSLDKEYPDTIKNWVKNILKKYPNCNFFVSPKIDGLSITLVYEGGHFIRAYTRGDGLYGQDVTERFKYIVPQQIKYKKKVELDGECTCTLFKFKNYEDDFAFPRNFTVGVLRPAVKNTDYKKLLQQDSSLRMKLRDLTFICFNANFENCKSKVSQLEKATKMGFKTVLQPTKKSQEWGIKNKLGENWCKKACRYAYDKIGVYCDGIVVEVDDLSVAKKLGVEVNGLNPKGSRAVKLRPEDQPYEIATIKNIEWNLSKRGIFIPRVNLKPVVLKGAEFNWVNGISYKYVEEGQWGEGGKIKLIRSGDVIPRIMGTVKPSKKNNCPFVCPYCGTKLKIKISYDDDGEITNKHLICPNKNCEGIKSNKVVKYFEVLGIDDVAGATISKLYEEGYTTVKKIYNVKEEALLKLDRFQQAKTDKVINGLKKARKLKLCTFMYASGFFDSHSTGLGETKLQWFIDYFGIDNILSGKINLEVMPEIENVKEKVWDLFVSGFENWHNFYLKLKNIVSFSDFDKKKLNSKKLKGEVFCFTGFRDKHLVEIIENNGGIYKDNLTKKTTILFAAKNSNKTQRAEKEGIKVIPYMEAEKFLNKILK
jgi:DNA ligase (NAD+)